MELTPQQIQKIGKLARLALNEEEASQYSGDLSNILTWVEQLQELDTNDIPPMTGVAEDLKLPMREDAVAAGNQADQVLSNAPHHDYGYFLVPTVIE